MQFYIFNLVLFSRPSWTSDEQRVAPYPRKIGSQLNSWRYQRDYFLFDYSAVHLVGLNESLVLNFRCFPVRTVFTTVNLFVKKMGDDKNDV